VAGISMKNLLVLSLILSIAVPLYSTDAPENIDSPSGILENEFKLKLAINGKLALKLAQSETQPDVMTINEDYLWFPKRREA